MNTSHVSPCPPSQMAGATPPFPSINGRNECVPQKRRLDGCGQHTFLLFLMVTRCTPGTGFIPSFSIAFLLFFSLRLCLDLPSPGGKKGGLATGSKKRAAVVRTVTHLEHGACC